jgi:type I restriction enzyme S subunit
MNKLKLKSVSKLITKGTTPSTIGKSFKSTGIKFIKSESIQDSKFLDKSLFSFIDAETNDKLKRSRIEEDDLLFSIAGAYLGKIVIVQRDDVPSNTNQAVGIVRIDKQKADINYLYYYFSQRNINQYINKLSSQSSQPNLNLELLGNLEFNNISLFSQRKIAAVLSSLDDKIELNNKINAELEATAKTLYDYWFVQFDFPDANGKPYKSSGGKMVYNEILKRKIPEGWEVQSLANLISTNKSGDWGKEEPDGNYISKVECIRGTDINGINGKGEVKSPERYILEKNEHKILTNRDQVVEISGGSPVQSTGRLAYITQEVIERFQNPIICSNFCKAISLKEEDYFFFFVYSWNKAYDNGVFFGYEGKTSGIKNLLFDTLVSNYHIAIPDEKHLKDFQLKVSLFEKQRQKNLKQNQELSALRDWLLPMLMNGQVSVGKRYEEEEEVLSMAAEDEVPYQTKIKS